MKLSSDTEARLKAALGSDARALVRKALHELRATQLEKLATTQDTNAMLREQGKVWALDKLLNDIFESPTN